MEVSDSRFAIERMAGGISKRPIGAAPSTCGFSFRKASPCSATVK